MKKRGKLNIFILICIIAIIVLLIGFKVTVEEKNSNNIKDETKGNRIEKNDTNLINEIKNEINATADTNMYQIETEYDGRNIIQVKSNIQYDTVLAGILKNGKPLEEEINNLLENKPNKKGIWISNQSKDKFLNILKNNNINNYHIDNEGYLYCIEENNNEASKILNDAISSNKLYIVDILGTCYVRDDLSGEIVEYPFEKMDPYQVLDIYNNENNIILVITTNSKLKLSNKEILYTILGNFKKKIK